MKKSAIALLLSIALSVGSIGAVPVYAAEMPAEDAAEGGLDEQAEVPAEEAIEANEEAGTGEIETEEDASDGAVVVNTDQFQEEEPVEEAAEEQNIDERDESLDTDEADIKPADDDGEAADAATEAEDLAEDALAEVPSADEPLVVEEEIETAEANEAKGDVVDYGTWGYNIYWELTGLGDDLTLTFIGSGNMFDDGSYEYSQGIPWRLYRYREKIRTVVIGEGITTICSKAFYECYYLKSITIPNSIESIGDKAFYNCISLTEITLPDSLTSIGEEAFSCCVKLPGIKIPDSVTKIGKSAFYYCSGLKDAALSNNLTRIEEGLFDKCSALTSVAIPDGVTSIGDYAFKDCQGLESITIPDSVTNIGEQAFYDCENLTSVSIPDKVTSIGASAFSFCESLEKITIPDKVTSIGERAFYGCDNLMSVSLSKSLTSIEDELFYCCFNLTKVIIPEGVTSIGEDAFKMCARLKSVLIPDSVTSIGKGAFYYCDSLWDLRIPKSVTEIGDDVFQSGSVLVIGVYNGSYGLEYVINNELEYFIICDIHTWNKNYTVDEEATCSEEGSKSIHCSVCNEIDKSSIKIIPKTEHDYGEWTTTKKATCTKAGSRKRVCEYCEYVQEEAIPATGHKWGEWTVVKEATDDEEGLETRACLNDGSHKEERTIPKRSHIHKLVKTAAKTITCTENGNTEYWTCSECGGVFSDSKGVTEISLEDTVVIASGHKWASEYTVDRKATYTEEGSKSIHCSVCNIMKEGSETPIPKLSQLGKTTRGDMFNLANNVKVTWKEVPGAKYYKVYREGITNPKETQAEPVIVTSGLVGWDKSPGLTNGNAYRYKIVASLTGKGDPSGDSPLSYSKVMYRLKTVVIRSVKNTTPGKVIVKYDKTTSGDSYVLQYSENEDMTGAKTKVVLGANNTSYTIGGLKKGKTYYISIRVRKKVNGIDYYTTFGVPRKIKITQ